MTKKYTAKTVDRIFLGILPVILFFILAGTHIIVKAEPPPDAKYIGVEACKMCHSDKYDAWSKTAHSKSFELLVIMGQDKNEKCLPCHSTGYGKESGFKDAESTPDLKGTTCEACHGPGSEHNGDAEKINRVFPATVCAGCHKNFNIHGES